MAFVFNFLFLHLLMSNVLNPRDLQNKTIKRNKEKHRKKLRITHRLKRIKSLITFPYVFLQQNLPITCANRWKSAEIVTKHYSLKLLLQAVTNEQSQSRTFPGT